MNELEKENWVNVFGFEDFYQVSNLGRIRSKSRSVLFSDGRVRDFIGKIRKQSLNKKRGYMYVSFRVQGFTKTMSVHRVVAESFLGKKDDLVVDHIDNNRLNNNLNNLQWVTYRENTTKGVSKDGFPGVCWHKRNNKYIASIYNNGKINHLGYFDSKTDAKIAYDKALSNV